jgi:hypothetical protein
MIERLCGTTDGNDLCVRRGIRRGSRQVVTATDDVFPAQNRGSDRHFIGPRSPFGFLQSDGHPEGVEIAARERRFWQNQALEKCVNISD